MTDRSTILITCVETLGENGSTISTTEEDTQQNIL
jgi:hypothetical protein